MARESGTESRGSKFRSNFLEFGRFSSKLAETSDLHLGRNLEENLAVTRPYKFPNAPAFFCMDRLFRPGSRYFRGQEKDVKTLIFKQDKY